jgi:hypothetical protein
MKFGRSSLIVTVIVALVVIASASGFVYGYAGAAVCLPEDIAKSENFQKTIAALDGIVDLGLKLSTSLVGFGAALLIGLKGGLTLTVPVRTSIFLALLMFIQSAFSAVAWRIGIANSWLNKCLNMVVEDYMQRLYGLHLVFFLSGLLFLLILIIVVILSSDEKTFQNNGSMYTRKAYSIRDATRRPKPNIKS